MAPGRICIGACWLEPAARTGPDQIPVHAQSHPVGSQDWARTGRLGLPTQIPHWPRPGSLSASVEICPMLVGLKDPWPVSRRCLEPRWFVLDPTSLACDNILNNIFFYPQFTKVADPQSSTRPRLFEIRRHAGRLHYIWSGINISVTITDTLGGFWMQIHSSNI